jgi:CBS domain-containing protein
MPANMKVKDAIVKGIYSVDSEQSAKDAAEVMVAHDIGSVLVTRAGSYVGIVTEKDVLKKVILQDLDPAKTPLKEIASAPLVSIRSDQSVGEAALLMLQKKIRRLLVVDGGKVIGIITEGDLDRATLDTMMSLSGY